VYGARTLGVANVAAGTGFGMTSQDNAVAGKRMLADLGHTLAGEAGRIDEALELAKYSQFDVAILDVNLNGQPISPVVEILVERRLPFVFATGYGQHGVPEPYRTTLTLQKPFQVDALAQAIEAATPVMPG
jgi:CheY-like chemotaxis protein